MIPTSLYSTNQAINSNFPLTIAIGNPDVQILKAVVISGKYKVIFFVKQKSPNTQRNCSLPKKRSKRRSENDWTGHSVRRCPRGKKTERWQGKTVRQHRLLTRWTRGGNEWTKKVSPLYAVLEADNGRGRSGDRSRRGRWRIVVVFLVIYQQAASGGRGNWRVKTVILLHRHVQRLYFYSCEVKRMNKKQRPTVQGGGVGGKGRGKKN